MWCFIIISEVRSSFLIRLLSSIESVTMKLRNHFRSSRVQPSLDHVITHVLRSIIRLISSLSNDNRNEKHFSRFVTRETKECGQMMLSLALLLAGPFLRTSTNRLLFATFHRFSLCQAHKCRLALYLYVYCIPIMMF